MTDNKKDQVPNSAKPVSRRSSLDPLSSHIVEVGMRSYHLHLPCNRLQLFVEHLVDWSRVDEERVEDHADVWVLVLISGNWGWLSEEGRMRSPNVYTITRRRVACRDVEGVVDSGSRKTDMGDGSNGTRPGHRSGSRYVVISLGSGAVLVASALPDEALKTMALGHLIGEWLDRAPRYPRVVERLTTQLRSQTFWGWNSLVGGSCSCWKSLLYCMGYDLPTGELLAGMGRGPSWCSNSWKSS